MNDESSELDSREEISQAQERPLTGIVAELAGLLAGTKIEETDYGEYLAKKYS